MHELKNIATAYRAAERAGRRAALATLLRAEGSSYRRAGARMLIVDDGQTAGGISGGCLEGDALKKALFVIARQRPMLVEYDTSDEEGALLGAALGCHGRIRVLIEPLGKGSGAIGFFEKILSARRKAVIATAFSTASRAGEQLGSCLLLLEGEKPETGHLPAGLASFLVEKCRAVLETENSLWPVFGNETGGSPIEIFLELITPPIALVVAGAGNDAQPLAQMAALLGWDVTIADGRPALAQKGRFEAAGCVVVARPDELLSKIAIDERTACVLLTHNFSYDMALLRRLVFEKTPYIGLLGPRQKLSRMLGELEGEGIFLSEKELSKIYAPVGLDLGAEGPEAIALSIVAEIQAVFGGRSGGHLREREVSIHSTERG